MNLANVFGRRYGHSASHSAGPSHSAGVWSGPGALALVATLSLVLAAVGCASDSSGYDDGAWPDPGPGDNGGTPQCFSSNECPTGYTCSEFGTCDPPPASATDGGVPPPPPEVEYELSAPASSLRYVYVAMTELDALAKIDGSTLAVSSLAVGERPEIVATAPGSDTAVVLDSINGTATIVRPADGMDEKITFAILPHMNELVVDPTGRYAVAYFDLNKAIAEAGGIDFVDDIGSFQDVTVLSLIPGQLGAVDLTVGFRPREVEFDELGQYAYVITEDGISAIDLATATQNGPSIVPPLPVTSDPLSDPETVEVDVVSTGEYAIVREALTTDLRVMQLLGASAGDFWLIPLPEEPSDVDLSPDGTRAYALLREARSLAIIDIPGDALDPTGVEIVGLGAADVGSLVLSGDGTRGLIFTNAFDSEQITTIDLVSPGYPYTSWSLEKSLRTVAFNPAGDKAILFHAKEFGDPEDATTFDEFIDRSHGYSMFDFSTGFAKLQITPVLAGGVAFAPNAPMAYLTLDGGDEEGAVAELQTIELDTGVVRSLELGSPPDAVGVLPGADMAFVSQRHPLGRISFIDITTGDTRTITGFDLNSQIID